MQRNGRAMSEYIRSGPVSLYLHFPFCERKCRYCDFLSGPASAEAREEYIGLLCRESALRASEVTGPVDTVFIGGGTPSIMSPEQLWRVMDAVRSSCPVMDGAEISKNTSDTTMELANDQISIKVYGETVTYWNANEQYMPKMVNIPVGGSLRLGSIQFQPRSSGNLSLLWVGED